MKLGDKMNVRGKLCTIYAVHPAGTVDCVSDDGFAYRVTGLSGNRPVEQACPTCGLSLPREEFCEVCNSCTDSSGENGCCDCYSNLPWYERP